MIKDSKIIKEIKLLRELEEENYQCECDNQNSFCHCNCFDMYLNKIYNETFDIILKQYGIEKYSTKDKDIFSIMRWFQRKCGWKKIEFYDEYYPQKISMIVRTSEWLQERGIEQNG